MNNSCVYGDGYPESRERGFVQGSMVLNRQAREMETLYFE